MPAVFGAIAESLPVAFFGIGDTELLLIMTAVLIFFGGKKMPEFARGMGKALREFKRATGEVEREFKRVLDEVENPPQAPYTPATTAIPAVDPTAGIAPTLTEGIAPVQPPADPIAPPASSPTSEAIAPPAPPPAPPTIARRPPEEQEYHSDV